MKKLGKPALTAQVSKKTGLSKASVNKAITSTFNTISDDVAAGNIVRLIGFGSFVTRHRKARKGRNPQTGKIMDIAARKSPAFKAGRGFKDAVNK